MKRWVEIYLVILIYIPGSGLDLDPDPHHYFLVNRPDTAIENRTRTG